MHAVLAHRPLSAFQVLLFHRSQYPENFDIDYYVSWNSSLLANVAIEDNLEWATLCLTHGADPNRNLVDEYLPIVVAAAEVASLPMVRLLVSYGAKVARSGAAVMAAEAGKLDVVLFLLEKGADVNEMSTEHLVNRVNSWEEMGTPVQRAVAGGFAGEEMVRALVEMGADLKMRDRLGRSVMELATKKGNSRILEVLKDLGAEEESH